MVRATLRRLVVLIAVLALMIPAVGPAGAQSGPELASTKTVERGDYNSYIVIMEADPLVATEGRDNLDTSRAKNRGQQLRASHAQTLRNAGISTNTQVNDYVTVLNGFSALITYEQALKVAADPNVAMVLPDELQQPQTDSSPDFIGLTGPGEAWDAGITGKGVVVGIIDTGIWPEHPSFADNGLPAPPTGALPCQFGNTTHNPDDAPFTCNNKLIGARQMLTTYRAQFGLAPDEFNSARDDNGHGSHTASTAAGNAGVSASIFGDPVGAGPISGIAPDAHIIAYKGLGNAGGFSSDLAAAINQAIIDGVDVINYSIGGSATGLTADEIAFLNAAGAGVYVATSAGNTGPGAATIRNPAKVPWLTTVGANTQSRFLGGTIELGNGSEYVGASITDGTGASVGLVDAANAATGLNNDLCQSTPPAGTSKLNPAVVSGKIVLCRRGVNARADKSLAVLEAGGVGMIMYENDDVGNLFTDNHWVPSVHIDNTPGVAIKQYIAEAGAGATAEIRDTRSLGTWPSAPSTTVFSSRGPNVFADVIKPDVTAPGIQILAGNSLFPDLRSTPPGELFQAIAGTSMSSPHVAGLFALIKQAHPNWSAAAARSALMTTASQGLKDNNRTSPADPFDMGAGHVNPGLVDRKGSVFQPGLVYEAGVNEYLGWVCGASPANISPATCTALRAAGIPTDPSDLNLPSIAVADLAGSQTVTRKVTSVAQESGMRTYIATVQAPPGYSVTVSPSTFTLSRGQSVTYQVSIVNNSAPIGEWKFGALTWGSTPGQGGYKVRSPIAVKASQFNAPSLINGEGEAGSTEFDVLFGYTGAYNATAHGLVPATLTVSNVKQDAGTNPVFDPADVATGGANLHEFTLDGVSVFRIAMPPEATEANADLDIYVYNPSNVRVAASTASATNELITITNPVNGTWKVYVHGWSTPGGDSNYTMYSWAISALPGGSLTIDSAPASAVIGTVGTLELSWTGATAGEWHFGMVTHMTGATTLARTLVEVDNR